MALKAPAPCCRPIDDLSGFHDFGCEVSLFVTKLLPNFRKMSNEVIEDFWMCANLPAINGRISCGPVGPKPIVDDAKITRVFEKAVNVVDDEDVEIEEKGCPFQVSESRPHGRKLIPTAFWCICREFHFGQRKNFDFWNKARGVIREADKTVRNR